MKKIFKKNPPKFVFSLGLAFVLILTLISLGTTVYLTKTKDVITMVGSEKITVQDLNKALYGRNFVGTADSPENVTDEERKQFTEELIEAKIAELEAKKLGINVTEKEVKTDIDANVKNYVNYTSEQKELTKNAVRSKLLVAKVKEEVLGWREGKYLAFNFHKYLPTKLVDYQVTGQGDTTLIQKQKTAAKNLAEEIIAGLRNKTLTFEQAKAKLLSNPEIGEKAMEPRSPVFTKEFNRDEFKSGVDVFKDAETKNFAYGVAEGSVSEILTDKAEFNDSEQEYRYLVFIIEKAKNGQYKSAEDWLSAKKKEYGLTRNLTFGASEAQAAPAGCSPCDADNANIVVNLKYYGSDGNAHILTNQPFSIRGGGVGDPALMADSSPCGKISTLGLNSGTGGGDSLCGRNYSYFCNTSKVAYISFPSPSLGGTVPSLGNWRWDATRVGYTGWSTGGGASGPSLAGDYYLPADPDDPTKKRAYLNINGLNGTTISNTFTWYPHFQTPPTARAFSVNGITENFNFSTNTGSAKFASGTTISFNGDSTDNEDKVANRIYYRRKPFYGSWESWVQPKTSNTNAYGFIMVGGSYWVASGTNTPLSVAGLANGDYEWKWEGYDEHDASDQSPIKTFRIGNPPAPTCTLTPNPGTLTGPGTVRLSWGGDARTTSVTNNIVSSSWGGDWTAKTTADGYQDVNISAASGSATYTLTPRSSTYGLNGAPCSAVVSVNHPNTPSKIELVSPPSAQSYTTAAVGSSVTVPLQIRAQDNETDATTIAVSMQKRNNDGTMSPVTLPNCSYSRIELPRPTAWWYNSSSSPQCTATLTDNNGSDEPTYYYWTASGTDQHGLATNRPASRWLTVDDPTPVSEEPALTCTVQPRRGDVPLMVDIQTTATLVNAPYSYDMGDGAIISNRTTSQTFTYTYMRASDSTGFTVRISSPNFRGGEWIPCGDPQVIPTNPNNPDGGEVSP